MDTGDYSYVHAEYHPDPPPEQMIEVTITPNVVEPGWGTDYRPGNPQTRQFNITGSLVSSLSPFPGTVILTAKEVCYSGGHMVVDRAMSHDPDPKRIEDIESEGTFEATYEDNCQWGGQFQIMAYYMEGFRSFCDADTVSITFDYLIDLENQISADPGIVKYTGGNDDDPIEPSGEVHPFNHYIDNVQIETMENIINRFRELVVDSLQITPPEFWINDISLPNGGRFTCCAPWWGCNDHTAHRQGCQADVKYGGSLWSHTHAMYGILRDVISFYTPLPPMEYPEYNYSHFHVRFCCQAWAPGTPCN